MFQILIPLEEHSVGVVVLPLMVVSFLEQTWFLLLEFMFVLFFVSCAGNCFSEHAFMGLYVCFC